MIDRKEEPGGAGEVDLFNDAPAPSMYWLLPVIVHIPYPWAMKDLVGCETRLICFSLNLLNHKISLVSYPDSNPS